MGLGHTFVGLAERLGWIPPPPDIEDIAGDIRSTMRPARSTALADPATARKFVHDRLHATEDVATGQLTLPCLPGEHWIGPIDRTTREIIPYGLLLVEILKPKQIGRIVANSYGLKVYYHSPVNDDLWLIKVKAATPGSEYGARVILGIICSITGKSATELGLRYYDIAHRARKVSAKRNPGHDRWVVSVV